MSGRVLSRRRLTGFALVPPTAVAHSPASTVDLGAAARRDYELTLQVSTVPVWDYFISNYPSGFYTDLAQAQRNKILAEVASIAAVEKAKVLANEQKRLAGEGAKATEQAKAAHNTKAAEAARLLAEQKQKTV